jgi:pimeloyl-ACP methyl ester carboxylesterase
VAGLIYLDGAYIYAYCDSSLSEFFSGVQKYSLEKLEEAEVPTPMPLIPAGWQKYTDIKPPILAIYAKQSVVGNEKIVEAIQRNIPSARIVILPNAEHFVYRSNETEVLSEMEAFLGRLP